MLTRTALAVLAAGTMAAAGSTSVLVASAGPERGTAARAEHAQRADAAAKPARTAGAGETADEPATTVTPPPCPADVTNHGAYVGAVARGELVPSPAPTAEPQPGDHGALVSAAARSDCGKDAAGDANAAKARQAEKAAAREAAAADRAAGPEVRSGERGAAKAREAREAREARDERGTAGRSGRTPGEARTTR